MNRKWILQGEADRVVSLTLLRDDPKAQEDVRPVLTVQDVCRFLRKSRRQVYRYVKAQRLRPSARILGQWLFAPGEVNGFKKGEVPRFLKPFFWDVRLSDVSLEHHQDFILSRLLESGDRRAMGWVFQKYPRSRVADFLRKRGAELLSRRSWHFWALQLGLRARTEPQASWRQRGRHWGGVG